MSDEEDCAYPNGVMPPGFCATDIPLAVNKPRSVVSLGTSDMLILERGTSSIVLLSDSDDDGLADAKLTVATASRLNHGLAVNDNYVYASSDVFVYRWRIGNGENFRVTGDLEVVIENMNADGMGGAPGGHTTRTLIFDASGRLYISVGSNGNVDPDSYRSRIRRFDLTQGNLPLDFQTGEVFADGLRNEVGLAFDRHGVLWGVENGADNLYRKDLGGDIHNDNPAEELNRFPEEDAGKHWGYPYCWTEFSLPADTRAGIGTAWAWPSFLADETVTDEQCREDYVPSIVAMQAHSAPLGITFYDWKPLEDLPVECTGNSSFPEYMDGYAFIAFHGSWNRDVPTGYKVVYVPMDDDGNAIGDPVDLLAHKPPKAAWGDGFRPVDVDFDACGRLIVTSDGTGQRGSKVVLMSYDNSADVPDPALPGFTNPPVSDSVDIHSGSLVAFAFSCLFATFGLFQFS